MALKSGGTGEESSHSKSMSRRRLGALVIVLASSCAICLLGKAGERAPRENTLTVTMVNVSRVTARVSIQTPLDSRDFAVARGQSLPITTGLGPSGSGVPVFIRVRWAKGPPQVERLWALVGPAKSGLSSSCVVRLREGSAAVVESLHNVTLQAAARR